MRPLWLIGPCYGHCKHPHGYHYAHTANTIVVEAERVRHPQMDADGNVLAGWFVSPA